MMKLREYIKMMAIMMTLSRFSHSCIVTINVMYNYHSNACIIQLADCTRLSKLFHLECSS